MLNVHLRIKDKDKLCRFNVSVRFKNVNERRFVYLSTAAASKILVLEYIFPFSWS